MSTLIKTIIVLSIIALILLIFVVATVGMTDGSKSNFIADWGSEPVIVANFSNNPKYRGNVTMSEYTLMALNNYAYPQAKTLVQRFFDVEDCATRWLYYPFGLRGIVYRMPSDATCNLYSAIRAVYRINAEVYAFRNRPTLVVYYSNESIPDPQQPVCPMMSNEQGKTIVARVINTEFEAQVARPMAAKLGASILPMYVATCKPRLGKFYPHGVNNPGKFAA